MHTRHFNKVHFYMHSLATFKKYHTKFGCVVIWPCKCIVYPFKSLTLYIHNLLNISTSSFNFTCTVHIIKYKVNKQNLLSNLCTTEISFKKWMFTRNHLNAFVTKLPMLTAVFFLETLILIIWNCRILILILMQLCSCVNIIN